MAVGQFSGSSITAYNSYIQPNIEGENFEAIWGEERGIRSDEWAVQTMYMLSQGASTFDYFNSNLRGTSTDMFTLINAPVSDILMIGKPFHIGFLLFGNDAGLSIWWFGRLIALVFSTFELSMILTNKKKLVSLCAAILLTFSSATQWWYSTYLVDLLIYGQLLVVFLNVFITGEKKYYKYLSALGILISATGYVFSLYPAWQVPLVYVFGLIGIWVIVKNRKDYKINKHDIIVIIITVICILALLGYFWIKSSDSVISIMSTDYPGNREVTGGDSKGVVNTYGYVYGIFLADDEIGNTSEYSGMLSFFPLPIIIALIYMLKNKKKDLFLILMLILSCVMFLWINIGFGELISKLILFSFSTESRMNIILGIVQIYILVYVLGNIKENESIIENNVLTIVISIIFTVFSIYMANTNIPENYMSKSMMLRAGLYILLISFGMFKANNIKVKNITLIVLMIFALLNGAKVNPLIKSTDVIYEKPFAKKIQEIDQNDNEAIWICDNTSFVVNNYVMANGVKTLNSTNPYPDFSMYEKLFGEEAAYNEAFKSIYNRYAHVSINIVDEETSLDLMSPDSFTIHLNYEDLEKLNVKYIVSLRNLNETDFNMNFDLLYSEDGIYIFEVKY